MKKYMYIFCILMILWLIYTYNNIFTNKLITENYWNYRILHNQNIYIIQTQNLNQRILDFNQSWDTVYQKSIRYNNQSQTLWKQPYPV